MKFDDKQQLIVIEALRCYRDKLVSMKIDAKPVTECLDEFRREKEQVEAEEKKNKEVVVPEEEIKEPLNPGCSEGVCQPSFWVMERKLCLYCGYRG